MKILGIESSCDESALALIEVNPNQNHHLQSHDHSSETSQSAFLNTTKTILAHYITTHNNHNYGGVIPESAARQHYYYLPKMLSRLLSEYPTALSDIDMVCASTSPGLIGGLMIGSCVAKAVASHISKPFYPIHHIEAHLLSPLFENNNLHFPYIALIASGGHTILAHVTSFSNYTILGQTADDAMGELFDKVAKYIGLPFPGGPEVEKLALNGTPKYHFKLPKIRDNPLGFSFSGLKTAILRQIDELLTLTQSESSIKSLSLQDKQDICASLQHTVIKICEQKFIQAMELFPDTTNLILAGGVGANKALRSSLNTLAQTHNKHFIVPDIKLCTDNAVMIAWAGYLSYMNPQLRLPNINSKCTNHLTLSALTASKML